MIDDSNANIRILVIADIVGRPGRRVFARLIPGLKKSLKLDLVIVNGENAAGGLGCTTATAKELLDGGADILTMGNHVWDKKDLVDYIVEDPRIIRPANFPPGTPGMGHHIIKIKGKKIAVINLQGRIFMLPIDCPFRSADAEMEKIAGADIILVDMHAEATSEKIAMGYYLDGRVSAVWGTHTHVQTADLTILPGGTLYVTDLGMTGPVESVIGIKKELIIHRLLTGLPVKFEVPRGDAMLQGLFMEISPEGIPVSYRMINEKVAARNMK